MSSWPSPSSPNRDTLTSVTRLFGTPPRETFIETTVPIRWLFNDSPDLSDFTRYSPCAGFERSHCRFIRFFTDQETHRNSTIAGGETRPEGQFHLRGQHRVRCKEAHTPATLRFQSRSQGRIQIA